ncbi:MAG: 3-isopropylmalate dehydratase small subunit [Tissierellia bacterium]|jgi:3-isopropylmalate/(R)-2-methylmalate dehydratase small subunit|nr:3-isopropylmalate dehydratase small subunit [Bacillota bacterium]NLK57768.1 3-isopropylmalate dehydratase small subunit [Tissierellia bacterium]
MKFIKHTGTAVPLCIDNIDTDQLIPKQYLKGTEKTGYADALFDTWRYDENGDPVAEFPLNRPEYRNASLLIAGDNFGCGSSREHAAWALQDYGFRVVIAGSFSPIFYMNWLNNGNLPIQLPKRDRDALAALPPETEMEVDLQEQKLRAGGKVYSFELDAAWKERLLTGRDAIDLTLDFETEISAYEKKNPYWQGGCHAG